MLRAVAVAFGDSLSPIPSLPGIEFEKTKPLWKQVHGVNFAWVEEPHQECGECDALLTTQSHLPIAVVTADCVPIILEDMRGRGIAVIHAGWRGSLAHISEKTWTEFSQKLSISSQDVRIHIGPAIGPCCYEVAPELVENFTREFPSISAKEISPAFRRLDLQTLHQKIFSHLGVSKINVVRECTYCEKRQGGAFKYSSYRRAQKSGQDLGTQRQWSIAGIL